MRPLTLYHGRATPPVIPGNWIRNEQNLQRRLVRSLSEFDPANSSEQTVGNFGFERGVTWGRLRSFISALGLGSALILLVLAVASSRAFAEPDPLEHGRSPA